MGFLCFFLSFTSSEPLRYHIYIISSYLSRTSIFHFNYVFMPFKLRVTRFHSQYVLETTCVIVTETALDLPSKENACLRYFPSVKRAQSYNALGPIYVDTTLCCRKYSDGSYTFWFKTFQLIVILKNRFKILFIIPWWARHFHRTYSTFLTSVWWSKSRFDVRLGVWLTSDFGVVQSLVTPQSSFGALVISAVRPVLFGNASFPVEYCHSKLSHQFLALYPVSQHNDFFDKFQICKKSIFFLVFNLNF